MPPGAPGRRVGRSCAACLEYTTGSDFVNEFGAGGPYAPGVAYTNIATRYDEYVFPYTSGLVPGTDTSNIVVQDHCPADHSEDDALASSPVAAAYSLNALDPTHPRPVPCMSVAPFTGTPVG